VSNALASKQGALNPLKSVDPKDVLTRVLNEESTKDIAKDLGVTRSALNQWLLANAETEWRAAQVIRAVKRKEEAEDRFEEIQERIAGADKEERDRLTLSLSLAREKLKAAQWDLERVCRRIYGQDQPPDNAGRLSITLNISGGDATIAPQHGITVDESGKEIA